MRLINKINYAVWLGCFLVECQASELSLPPWPEKQIDIDYGYSAAQIERQCRVQLYLLMEGHWNGNLYQSYASSQELYFAGYYWLSGYLFKNNRLAGRIYTLVLSTPPNSPQVSFAVAEPFIRKLEKLLTNQYGPPSSFRTEHSKVRPTLRSIWHSKDERIELELHPHVPEFCIDLCYYNSSMFPLSESKEALAGKNFQLLKEYSANITKSLDNHRNRYQGMLYLKNHANNK